MGQSTSFGDKKPLPGKEFRSGELAEADTHLRKQVDEAFVALEAQMGAGEAQMGAGAASLSLDALTLAGNATDTLSLTIGEQTANILIAIGAPVPAGDWWFNTFEITRNDALDYTLTFGGGNEGNKEAVLLAMWRLFQTIRKSGDFDAHFVPQWKGTGGTYLANDLDGLALPAGDVYRDFGDGIYIFAAASPTSFVVGAGITAGMTVDP